jgi:hypothetical protein
MVRAIIKTDSPPFERVYHFIVDTGRRSFDLCLAADGRVDQGDRSITGGRHPSRSDFDLGLSVHFQTSHALEDRLERPDGHFRSFRA